jgi:hypothetical protein
MLPNESIMLEYTEIPEFGESPLNPFEQEKKMTSSELSQMLKEKLNLERSADTIRDWMQKGCRGVRLEHIPAGGVLMSSYEAVQRFFAERSVK